ncbi:MAG TPA: MarR family winged helix-turn-helix transcriptional regulator [Burkholderiaceae bacterium]|nr:MarR family winged helix-turn-helix transcriptional regulator [Burkholderiaceae bacterium]
MHNRKQPLPDVRKAAARALQDDVAWQARVLARRLGALADRRLEGTGLSHAQFVLLCLISSASDDTIGALARRAGLDQSTMSRNLDVLARAQLVEVTTAVPDRRRRAVWLTERGLFTLARAIPIASKLQIKLTSILEEFRRRDDSTATEPEATIGTEAPAARVRQKRAPAR